MVSIPIDRDAFLLQYILQKSFYFINFNINISALISTVLIYICLWGFLIIDQYSQ